MRSTIISVAETLDQHRAFEGYDGIGMTIFPWKRYDDGTQDIRSLEDFIDDVRERSCVIDCRFVAALGMDFWYGAFPNPVILAEAYSRGLDVLAQAGQRGAFLHLWASEPDHLGASTAVEEMLTARWAGAEND